MRLAAVCSCCLGRGGMAGWLEICEEEWVRGEFGEGLGREGSRRGHVESIETPMALGIKSLCVCAAAVWGEVVDGARTTRDTHRGWTLKGRIFVLSLSGAAKSLANGELAGMQRPEATPRCPGSYLGDRSSGLPGAALQVTSSTGRASCCLLASSRCSIYLLC